MWYKSADIFLTLLVVSYVQRITGLLKITNIECESLQERFEVKKCVIEPVDRVSNALSIHITLNNYTTNNLTVDFKLLKKSNSWNKFFLDMTNFDVCKFLRNTKKFPYYNIIYENLKGSANFVHTCPLNHDLILDHYIMHANATMMDLIPVGEYAFISKWYSYGIPAIIFKSRVKHEDYFKDW